MIADLYEFILQNDATHFIARDVTHRRWMVKGIGISLVELEHFGEGWVLWLSLLKAINHG